VASTSSVLLAPTDAKIVVRQTVGATNFGIGETVSQATSGATGEIEHRVEIARGGNYKWIRLYLVNCTGTFVANTAYTVTGTTTSTTGLITYTGITTAILAADFRPDLVSYPADGEIATLPYEHVVFTENPYASESVSVTNNVVYGYEGSIGLIPAEDIWYEHRTQPQIINHYNTEVIIKEVEKQVEVIREIERIVCIDIPMPVIVEQVAPPPPPPPVKKEKPVVPVFVEQNWNLKPIKIDSVGGALGVPAIISVTPTIIDEGFPVFLPLDSPAPPEETPPVYGGSGGGATGRDPASVYGGGTAWKGGEIEPISSFGFQDVNAI